ncbi:hypothetical protein R3P38DRAFT_3385802 [Favolaschia claudopus]|uniref:Uncharacterized protein n=1 Tax=Favolaschia claudopus TaxID=2862362 RepID=A0AAW0DW22_9AGAR
MTKQPANDDNADADPGPAPTLPLLPTLNPTALVSTDHLDISQKLTIQLHFRQPNTKPKSQETDSVNVYFLNMRARLPFPPRTSGFLYFHRPANAAPLEGSVRFRLTSSSSPSSFETGHDLLLPLGVPWQLNLPQIACHGHFRIRDQLLHDNLVTEDQLSLCQSMYIYPYSTLFRLTQEFPVNFGGEIVLAMVGEDKIVVGRTPTPFQSSTGWKIRRTFFPWAGSATARFEPSTDREYKGRRVLHLRILRIIQPVFSTLPPDDQALSTLERPKAGELLVRRRHKLIQPWAYDIDAPTNTLFRRGLDLLWNLDH